MPLKVEEPVLIARWLRKENNLLLDKLGELPAAKFSKAQRSATGKVIEAIDAALALLDPLNHGSMNVGNVCVKHHGFEARYKKQYVGFFHTEVEAWGAIAERIKQEQEELEVAS